MRDSITSTNRKVGQATTGKSVSKCIYLVSLCTYILTTRYLLWKVSTWDCNNPMAHIFEELSNAEQEVIEKKIAQASKHGLQAWQWMFLLDDDDEFEKCCTAALPTVIGLSNTELFSIPTGILLLYYLRAVEFWDWGRCQQLIINLFICF